MDTTPTPEPPETPEERAKLIHVRLLLPLRRQ